MANVDTMIFTAFGLIFATVVTLFVTDFFVEGIAQGQNSLEAGELVQEFKEKAEYVCESTVQIQNFNYIPPEEGAKIVFPENDEVDIEDKDGNSLLDSPKEIEPEDNNGNSIDCEIDDSNEEIELKASYTIKKKGKGKFGVSTG